MFFFYLELVYWELTLLLLNQYDPNDQRRNCLNLDDEEVREKIIIY